MEQAERDSIHPIRPIIVEELHKGTTEHQRCCTTQEEADLNGMTQAMRHGRYTGWETKKYMWLLTTMFQKLYLPFDNINLGRWKRVLSNTRR